MSANYFQRIDGTPHSTTGTGLDQLTDTLATDLGLRGRLSESDLEQGLAAANALNALILDTIAALGMGSQSSFDADDVIAINAHIRSNNLETFVALHGDDENGEETGYHLLQNDGASSRYRGDNLADTVADGLYHIGFEIVDGRFQNEDGDANASVQQVAEWLSQFFTDHSTTGTGLDRITDMIMANKGLDRRLDDEEIAAGADAANGINTLIADAIDATNAADDGVITIDDVRAINEHIRANNLDTFVELHGDDENGVETGFHVVQNDGASGRMFGENFVNTVADGIYHIGFEIQGDNIVNEDGNANASLDDLANWLNYFYMDQGSTGTGLDELVQVIKSDKGLARRTDAGDINEGAAAADGINHLIVDAIESQGLANDGLIDIDDVRAINSHIRENNLDAFVELHGDDENGEETGFHLVQNDGGRVKYRGDKFIDTVIDGLFHLGFEIEGDNVLNEDGDANANLGDLATWLNNFYLGAENTFGSEDGDNIRGLNTDDQIWGRGGNDRINAKDGDDWVDGGDGNDKISGQDGNDELMGGLGNDRLNGGDGDDILQGDEGADQLWGKDGADQLFGGADNDRLSGGNDADLLVGGEGDDRLNGGADNDVLHGDAGKDKLWGKDGEDQLFGGADNDHLSGGNDADLLVGGEGDDRLNGGADNDELHGDAGKDKLWGKDGEDQLFGGADNDYLSGGDDADLLVGGEGDDSLNGGADDDVVHGDAGADRLWGKDGSDQLLGGEGNDRLSGGADNDLLVDGDGADHVNAGSGDDVLLITSDAANDTFWGKSGADDFVLSFSVGSVGSDEIRDFSTSAGDQLIIASAEVEYALEQVRSNKALLTFTDTEGSELGQVMVYGQFSEADIVIQDNYLEEAALAWSSLAG